MSKCLQYIHSETDVFDFNDPKTPAGYHRLGAAASYKNAPSGLDGVNFCTVEVVRPTISDTLAMTIYPYKKGINPPVWYKSGGSNEWSTLPWNVYATKSDFEQIGTPTKLCSFAATGNASVNLSAYKFLFIAGIYNGQILTSQLIPKSRFNSAGMFLAYKDAESSQYRAKLSLGSSTIECSIFENFSSADVYGIS